MAVSEVEIMKQIQALSRGGVRLFRNNVGFDAQNKVKYGLMPGSSDLIGWTQIEITPHHIGRKLAIFTAIEVKSQTDKATKEQINFIEQVRGSGGIAGIAHNVEEARGVIDDYV